MAMGEATAKLQHFYSVTFTFIVKKDKHCKNCQKIRHFSFHTSFFPLLTLSFDCAVVLLHSCRLSPSIELNVSFDFTEMPSPQRLHGEPSPSQRRRLVIETPSLRQLVESKGKLQSIQKCASDYPIKKCIKTTYFN
jgi:hypothetical protein